MKLKSRPIMPGAIVSKIEDEGLEIQTISVYDESNFIGTTIMPKYTYNTGNTVGTITNYPPTTTTTSSGNTWWSSTTSKPKP